MDSGRRAVGAVVPTWGQEGERRRLDGAADEEEKDEDEEERREEVRGCCLQCEAIECVVVGRGEETHLRSMRTV